MGKNDGENEYLASPSWDCSWYWGFGYLQNKNIHHHLDTLNTSKNMFDAIKEYYGDTLNNVLQIDDNKNLWVFCELVETFYTLKETAEVLGSGGSHYTTNPIAGLIKNEKEVKRINEEVLPAIFDEIYKIFN
jgi:L-rhamnose isomerase